MIRNSHDNISAVAVFFTSFKKDRESLDVNAEGE